jgi:uncharacterized membrane protein
MANMQHLGAPVNLSRIDPSDWSKRLPILSIALFGLVVAISLAAYQLGIVTSIWDPFFGAASSEQVVTTSVLHFLPIPDAVLGVFGYGAEIVAEIIGGPQRWWRIPWSALAFGAISAMLVLVSIGLILLQALVVHAWCTLCLTSALISFIILGLGWHEPLAALRYLRYSTAQGNSVWTTLWGRLPEQQS